ncbi:MAG: RNA polymerase subunit sigma-70, partial [Paludibacteraceae bacterium]|nr:RNA polymerase subunit sigma-70 [Paludibacteraceae bacterium]
QEAVLALPTMQRTVFNLRYFDELSYEEIAAVTGSSVAAAKTNYHYAKQRIMKLIEA